MWPMMFVLGQNLRIERPSNWENWKTEFIISVNLCLVMNKNLKSSGMKYIHFITLSKMGAFTPNFSLSLCINLTLILHLANMQYHH